MKGPDYCSRSLALRAVDPRSPLFASRSLIEVRGEHLAVERGLLMTHDLQGICLETLHDEEQRRRVLVDYDARLDRLSPLANELRWDRDMAVNAKSFPCTLALYHPLRTSPIASLRLTVVEQNNWDNGLIGVGLLVSENHDDTAQDFALTQIARKIRRAAARAEKRNTLLLSLDRFVGHLGEKTLEATAMLQALIKLVVEAPPEIEGIVTSVPPSSSFYRLLAPLEAHEHAPVRQLGSVKATGLFFSRQGVLQEARDVELRYLYLNAKRLRRTMRRLDMLERGSPERRILDTAIVARGFLRQHVGPEDMSITPEIDAILDAERRDGGNRPHRPS